MAEVWADQRSSKHSSTIERNGKGSRSIAAAASLLQNLKILGCVILIGCFLQRGHPQFYRFLPQVDLNNIPYLDLVGGAGGFAIYYYAFGITGLIGHGPPFDDPGNFQIFIQPHRGPPYKRAGALAPTPLVQNLFYSILQRLTSLKNGSFAGSDGDGLAGLGVNTSMSRAGLNLEGAKPGEGDLIALFQGLGNGLQNSGNCLLGILLSHTGLFGYGDDHFSFGHFVFPPDKKE